MVNTKKLQANRDYLFQPHPQPVLNLGLEGGVFAHVIDASFHSVLVRNATQKPISIPAKTKLGKLYDYNADGCYLADPSDAHLAANSSWKQPKRYKFGAGHMSEAGPPLNSLMEQQDTMGITAWGQPDKQAALFEAANSYPQL